MQTVQMRGLQMIDPEMQYPSEVANDSASIWDDIRLACSPNEIESKVNSSSRDGVDLGGQIEAITKGSRRTADVSGVEAFSAWILNQEIRGKYVLGKLRDLISREFSEIEQLEEPRKISMFAELAAKLKAIHTSASEDDRSASLGDLLPDEFIMQSGSASAVIPIHTGRLITTVLSPYGNRTTQGNLLAREPSTPDSLTVMSDPYTWTYWMHSHSSWWTTFIGVWHASASTLTDRTAPTTGGTISAPVYSDWIMVQVGSASQYTINVPGEGCIITAPDYTAAPGSGFKEEHSAHYTDASSSSAAFIIGPYGRESQHAAQIRHIGGIEAHYCHGWKHHTF
jgi:hypothetical protein